MGYKFNPGNAESFADALVNLVPHTLRKIFLMDNLLKDTDMSNIFKSLSETQKGFQSFTLIQNQLGLKSI